MPADVYFEAQPGSPAPRGITVLAPPRPLPSVPCLTYDGRRTQWEPWHAALTSLCSKLDESCDACQFPGPLSISIGLVLPHDGEMSMWPVQVGTHPSGRARFIRRPHPAGPYMRLTAFLCPRCFHLEVLDHKPEDAGTGDHQPGEAEMVLCDGCDAPCGVGVTVDEARANLVALGGWAAQEWDLCAACNPGRTADLPPRVVALLRSC